MLAWLVQELAGGRQGCREMASTPLSGLHEGVRWVHAHGVLVHFGVVGWRSWPARYCPP